MMHVKVLLVDRQWVLVGSTNIDPRSFGLNDEVNLLVRSEPLFTHLLEDFEGDLRASEMLDLPGWQRRSVVERVLATLGRVIERHQ